MKFLPLVKLGNFNLAKTDDILIVMPLFLLCGIDSAVEIIHNVDRYTEKLIIEALEEGDPLLADELKKRMFVFEDILLLNDVSLRKVLRETEMDVLAKTCKGVDETLLAKITKNMSKRAAEKLAQEIQNSGPLRLSEIEEAQFRIIEIIKELESSGDIVVPKEATRS